MTETNAQPLNNSTSSGFLLLNFYFLLVVSARQSDELCDTAYRGETDGVLSAEMQDAIKRYQRTNGLRQNDDLNSDALAVMDS